MAIILLFLFLCRYGKVHYYVMSNFCAFCLFFVSPELFLSLLWCQIEI